MKNSGMIQRARYSVAGLRVAVLGERSLRTHLALSLVLLVAMGFLEPARFWWAVMPLAIATCWGFELMNAAIERLCDHLHPERHEAIGEVKDLASAAAFTANVTTAGLAIAMFVHKL